MRHTFIKAEWFQIPYMSHGLLTFYCLVDNAQGYVDALKKYLEDTCQTMKHTTLKSGNGYVCSLEINRRTFGSEGILKPYSGKPGFFSTFWKDSPWL